VILVSASELRERRLKTGYSSLVSNRAGIF
jgi:hypothetical protein